jgi:HK97 family phage portal protein
MRSTAQTFINQFPVFSIGNKRPTMFKMNRENMRTFSKSAIPRRAISVIKDNVLKMPYHLKSKDGLDHSAEIAIISAVLSKPNNVESYRTFFSQILEDQLVLDAGTFEKARSGNRDHPLFLFPIDGGTIECVMSWEGDPTQPRYAQFISGDRKYYLDSQIAYIRKTISTDSPFGLSPMETAFKYLQYLMNVQDYANDIASNAMPKFLTTLGKDVQPEQVNAFRAYIANEVQGQSALAIINTDTLESKQVSPIGDESLYLQWQKMLIQIIAVAFGIPSDFLGDSVSNDRSTVDEKNQNLLENTIKPYALVLQDAIQHHVVEFLGYGDILEFEYVFVPTLSQKETLTGIIRNLYITDIIKRKEARTILKQLFDEIDLTDTDESDALYITQYKTEENIQLAEASARVGGFNGSGDKKNSYGDKPTNNKMNGGN